jgi:hypothetical protein
MPYGETHASVAPFSQWHRHEIVPLDSDVAACRQSACHIVHRLFVGRIEMTARRQQVEREQKQKSGERRAPMRRSLRHPRRYLPQKVDCI